MLDEVSRVEQCSFPRAPMVLDAGEYDRVTPKRGLFVPQCPLPADLGAPRMPPRAPEPLHLALLTARATLARLLCLGGITSSRRLVC